MVIKKLFIVIALLSVLLMGCGNAEVAKTYEESDTDGILVTYSELNDGTWQCDDTVYQYRLELTGTLPNATSEIYYVVLTDNANLTFDEVSTSLYSSNLEVIQQFMKDSVIVEMK